ncbi:hypothetical protein O0L34_g493 [Tuta absoluta]|nr:hypothetical protein O0L34_g493 [Tuta absoluta]
MVLLGTNHFDSAYSLYRGARRGIHFQALSIWAIQTIFFNLCKACEVRMSCFTPTMFTAGKIRETQKDRDMKLSNANKARGSEPDKYFNTSFMELTPLKYNCKFMNSIWGFYNRYSPHNVKKINEALSFNVECQQSAGNSTNSGDPVIALPSAKLDSVWAAIKVSQNH